MSSLRRVSRSTVLCVSSALLCCVCQMQGQNEELYRRLHEFKSMFCATCHEVGHQPTVRPPARRTSATGETLILSDYLRRGLTTVVSFWANN